MAARRRPPALNRDHARPRTAPAPASPAVEAHLTALIRPEVFALGDAYRQQGLRTRILALPVMVAVVLAMIWRQVPSVSELGRLLAREGLLWTPPVQVSQQALSLCLRCVPARLFATILDDLLPRLQPRATARQRPLPPIMVRTQPHFRTVWVVDGTTLEALFKKVGLLRGRTETVNGGTVEAVLDLRTKLPVQVWLDPDPAANDKRFLDRLEALLRPGALLIMDRGFYSYPFFDWLTEHEATFVTRARQGVAVTITQVLRATPRVRDQVVAVGPYRSNPLPPLGPPRRGRSQRPLATVPDQCARPGGAPGGRCGGPLCPALAHRRGLLADQAPARPQLSVVGRLQRHRGPGLGHLAALRGAARPDRCGRRGAGPAAGRIVGRDGLPGALSLYGGLCARRSHGPGRLSRGPRSSRSRDRQAPPQTPRTDAP